MLTPLQEEVAAVIAALEEAKEFALAGGAALIMREQIERVTRDLDFFGLSAAAVDRLVPSVEQALRRAGFDVETVISGTGFARLVVQGFGEQTEVDLAADARLFPAELGRAGIPLLTSEELAVDKVLAVFGRAEARDFIDLMAMESQFDLGRLFTLAAEKDRGFDPRVFADMVGRLSRLSRAEFPIDDDAYEKLQQVVAQWRDRALNISRQQSRGAGGQRDRGPDTGLGL
jgi:hypothetical protein